MDLKKIFKYFLLSVLIVIFIVVIGFRMIYFYESRIHHDYDYEHNNERLNAEKMPTLECGDDLECNQNLAILKQDIRYCNNINDPEYRYVTCYRVVAESLSNPNICENIPYARGKDICFRELGISLSDADHCKKIMNRQNRGLCYFHLAIKTKDKSLCSKIPFFTVDFYSGDARKACARIN